MSDRACPHEAAVVEAARTRVWSDGLRAHVSKCADCSDTARLTAWIGDAATRLGRGQPAPEPTYIWLRAQLERRAREASTLSSFRLGAITILGLAAGLAGTAVMLLVLPAIAAVARIVRNSIATALAETSLLDMAALAMASLGSPLLLAAILLLILRPLR
jgi:hypothetical protein